MRSDPGKLNAFRVRKGLMASTDADGMNGSFLIKYVSDDLCSWLRIIASDGFGWSESGFPSPVFEHVSVSLQHRCPTWAEMDFVKRLFWDDDELVLQLHVPKSKHINRHNFCLHMWKPLGVEIPLPPDICV